jgi:hypothetical protein
MPSDSRRDPAGLRCERTRVSDAPLFSALSRPLIVRHLAEAAKVHGATVVSHGCTGKGNDQVRFEVGIANLAPELAVIAPVRDYAWTREKAIAYAEEKGLPIQQSKFAVLDRPERLGSRREPLPEDSGINHRGRLRLHREPCHPTRSR